MPTSLGHKRGFIDDLHKIYKRITIVLKRTHSARLSQKLVLSSIYRKKKIPLNNSRSGPNVVQIHMSTAPSAVDRLVDYADPQLSINARVGPVDRPINWDPCPKSLLISKSWVG